MFYSAMRVTCIYYIITLCSYVLLAVTLAEFLASLAHTRAGIPDAVVSVGAIKYLSTHLYSKDEEVHLIQSSSLNHCLCWESLITPTRHFISTQVLTACANALGYLSFNRLAYRLLLVECRKNPYMYRALKGHLAKDAKINSKFTSEFNRQRRLGLPSLR